jgi:hypothetical protein
MRLKNKFFQYSFYSVCLFGFVLSACVQRNFEKSKVNEFANFEDNVEWSKIPNFALARAPHVEVEAFVGKVKDSKAKQEIVDNDLLKINLKNIDAEKFTLLKKTYGGEAEFNENLSTYPLETFLPKSFSALMNKRFKPQRLKIPENTYSFLTSKIPTFAAREVFVQSNCWSTVYSLWTQPKNEYPFFFADEQDIQKAIFDNKVSLDPKNEGVESYFFQAQTFEPNKNLEPMDAVFISLFSGGKHSLVHAAIFIDDNIYFEKTGTDEEFAYRFVTFDNIKSKYSSHAGGWFNVRFRRLLSGTKLAHPDEVFGIENTFKIGSIPNSKEMTAYYINSARRYSLSRIKNIPIEPSALGFEFPKETQSPEFFNFKQ